MFVLNSPIASLWPTNIIEDRGVDSKKIAKADKLSKGPLPKSEDPLR
jgi:hypothetical protein